MPKKLSVAKAKAALSECIRSAEGGEPVIITRHGRAVAAVVRAADLKHLERLRAAGPESGLASLAGGWEGSNELVHLLRDHRRTGARGAPPLD